jgi:hypothetical protein
MELTSVEAAVCIKALQLAARHERSQGDYGMSAAYLAMRKDLFARYCKAFPSRYKPRPKVDAAPLTPEQITFRDGRWYNPAGVDVSLEPLWWKCEAGHSWQASLIERTERDAGCPQCAKAQAATP